MNQQKINELKQWMVEEEIDLTYISDPHHIAYFSGYESDPHERVLALFIALNSEPFLFTPALETEDAENNSWAYPVHGYMDGENPWEKIAQLIKKNGLPKKIATEKEFLSIARFEALRGYFPDADLSTNATQIVEKLQLIKTEDEVSLLLEAGNWADVALEIGFKAVTEGAVEQEIIAEIEYQLKRKGVRSMSFNTLVLAGKNAASPHGTPGAATITSGDLVLFDLGVVWKGYCSDVTRTVAYQEPTSFQKEIYGIVLEAQLAATAAVKPGITAGELDQIARSVIDKAGYGDYFNHRLGHGIGTTVHEFPSLITGNDLVIEKGMCFSMEPGIYIPGKVGVRIEDCVHVTDNGCEAFTKTPKELQILG